MDEFLVVTIVLVTASHTTPVNYSLKFLVVFKYLGIDFLVFSCSHYFEN